MLYYSWIWGYKIKKTFEGNKDARKLLVSENFFELQGKTVNDNFPTPWRKV